MTIGSLDGLPRCERVVAHYILSYNIKQFLVVVLYLLLAYYLGHDIGFITYFGLFITQGMHYIISNGLVLESMRTIVLHIRCILIAIYMWFEGRLVSHLIAVVLHYFNTIDNDVLAVLILLLLIIQLLLINCQIGYLESVPREGVGVSLLDTIFTSMEH